MDFWERLENEIDRRSNRKAVMADAGIALNSISTWKARGTYPAADVLHRIATSLGVSVEYLLTGEDRKDQWSVENSDLVRDAKALGPNHLSVVKVIVRALAAEPQPARPMPKHGRTVEQIKEELTMIVESDRADRGARHVVAVEGSPERPTRP